jgi:hypothetical protein
MFSLHPELAALVVDLIQAELQSAAQQQRMARALDRGPTRWWRIRSWRPPTRLGRAAAVAPSLGGRP